MAQKDQGEGLLDEAASQGKGALVGAAAVALAIPFFGWLVGGVIGGAALVVSVAHSRTKKTAKK